MKDISYDCIHTWLPNIQYEGKSTFDKGYNSMSTLTTCIDN